MKKVLLAFLLVPGLLLIACNPAKNLPNTNFSNNWKVQKLPFDKKITKGDPQKGLDYLVYGDYIGSGIPYEFMEKRLEGFTDTILNRSGKNGKMVYSYNVFKSENGMDVAAGNCFTCHSSELNGEMILGLGGTFNDFSKSQKFKVSMLNFLVKRKYKKNSEERAAFQNYSKMSKAITPYIQPPNPGVNPAFRVEEGCMNYRDKEDLKIKKDANFDMLKYTLASDTPPLWNVKKKNALYYNAMGRGDFRKLLMQASVLGTPDSTSARAALQHFEDVLAWVESLEPPKYIEKIDRNLAIQGGELFEEHCSKCHGTYGAKETYPNKLVALEVVKTDPIYARYFTQTSDLANWYNESWFGQSAPISKLEPSDGYIAPPLDGIWATAPYLHNGSVPTIDDLLNSAQRPTFWKRSGSSHDYNYEKLGWNYQEVEKGKGDWVYDTTHPGYGNQGHTFGDKLSVDGRRAVIEYLKTL